MPELNFLVEVPRIAEAFEMEVAMVALCPVEPLLPDILPRNRKGLVFAVPFPPPITRRDIKLTAHHELRWFYNAQANIEAFSLGTEDCFLQYSPTEGVSPAARAQARQHAEHMARGCYRLGKSIEKLEAFFGEPLLTWHERLEFDRALKDVPVWAISEWEE